MAIKVLVNGGFGRMGLLATKAIEADPELELVGQTGREYDLKKAIADSKAQVVVDFTNPEVVLRNCEMIIQAGCHPVIGTSGLTSEQVTKLQTECEKINLGGLIAPNFSLGAVLMMKYAQEIAKYMSNVEIIEMHHDKKLDSPSGTAMRTAELLANAAKLAPAQTSSKENVAGARGAQHRGIPIHAIRLPGFLAHEEIIFGNAGETLTLRHDSIDRESFMPGIRLACKKVVDLKRLAYGLEEIL